MTTHTMEEFNDDAHCQAALVANIRYRGASSPTEQGLSVYEAAGQAQCGDWTSGEIVSTYLIREDKMNLIQGLAALTTARCLTCPNRTPDS